MQSRGCRLLYLAIVLCVSIVDCSVEVPPVDKVAGLGDNVQYFCKIDGDPEEEAVAWKRRVNKTTEDIFHTWPPDGKKIDDTKYTFTESAVNPLETTLEVKNVAFTDTGRYSCEPTSYADGAMYGSLVVVGTPHIRKSRSLTEGQEAELVCEVWYSGPPGMDEAGIEPQMVMRLGSDVLHGNLTRTTPEPGQLCLLRSVYKKKMESSLHKRDLSCDVQVRSMGYKNTAARTLMVAFPVRNVLVSPIKREYRLGDNVSCTAEGYPKPTRRWEMVSSEGTPVDSSVLHISHKWVCVASNVVDRRTRYSKSSVVTYIDLAAVPRIDQIAIVFVLLLIVAVISSGVTGYKVGVWRMRGRQSNNLPSDDIQMKAYTKKESNVSDSGAGPNQPMLQELETCDGLDVDDTSKVQAESGPSMPRSTISSTMHATEIAPTGEIEVDEEHTPVACTSLSEHQSETVL